MKYNRFEDLPVCQVAPDRAVNFIELSTQNFFRGKCDLANQLQRAALVSRDGFGGFT